MMTNLLFIYIYIHTHIHRGGRETQRERGREGEGGRGREGETLGIQYPLWEHTQMTVLATESPRFSAFSAGTFRQMDRQAILYAHS